MNYPPLDTYLVAMALRRQNVSHEQVVDVDAAELRLLWMERIRALNAGEPVESDSAFLVEKWDRWAHLERIAALNGVVQ